MLVLAANYLNVEPLINACCQKYADIIKGKSVQEIRTTFGLEQLSAEEDAAVMAENRWAHGPEEAVGQQVAPPTLHYDENIDIDQM